MSFTSSRPSTYMGKPNTEPNANQGRGDADEDAMLEKMLRKELVQLQRKYRLMEVDSQQLLQGTGIYSSRFDKLLRNLSNDKEVMEISIEAVNSRKNAQERQLYAEKVTDMLKTYDKYEEDTFEAMDYVAELEHVVDITNKAITTNKLKLQKLFGMAKTVSQIRMRLRVTENKRHHATTRCNTKLAENAALRTEIYLMLMARGNFHHRHKVLKRQIARDKLRMFDIVNQGLRSYEIREAAIAKIQYLWEKNDRESVLHVLEAKDLQRVIQGDRKLSRFMETKNKERNMSEKDMVRKVRLARKLAEKVNQRHKDTGKQFRKILRRTDTPNTNVLIQRYLEQEQKNFSLFTLLTNLNNEIESLKQLVEALDEEVKVTQKSVHEETKKLTEEQAVQNEYDLKKASLDKAEAELEVVTRILNGLVQAVDVIKKAAGVKFTSATLGSDVDRTGNEITAQNLAAALKAIEKAIQEMLDERSLLIVKKNVLVDHMQLTLPASNVASKRPISYGGPFEPDSSILAIQLAAAENEEGEEESERSMNWMTYDEILELCKAKLKTTKMIGQSTNELNASTSTASFNSDPNTAEKASTSGTTAK